LAAILLAAAWTATPVLGQPIVESVDSIEWMAADSAVVVRGTIVAHKVEEDPPGMVWHTVTFHVDETLKGPHRPTLQFVVAANTIEKDVARWKQLGRPVLAFLDESRFVVARYRYRKFARFPLAPRNGWSKGSFLELDPNSKFRACTLDLKTLTRPEEMVRATKDAIATTPASGKLCDYWFDLPGEGGLTRLTVPLDARLEKRARQWIRSDDKDVRREGASALALFPSDENAVMLRRLLDDPASWIFVSQEGARLRKERVYSVREAAASVLKAWGYEVPPRILREPMPVGAEPAPPAG
jgi:hypothetical protein